MIDLTRSLEDRQDSANLQIAILSFINVIINYKAGEVRTEVTFRVSPNKNGLLWRVSTILQHQSEFMLM